MNSGLPTARTPAACRLPSSRCTAAPGRRHPSSQWCPLHGHPTRALRGGAESHPADGRHQSQVTGSRGSLRNCCFAERPRFPAKNARLTSELPSLRHRLTHSSCRSVWPWARGLWSPSGVDCIARLTGSPCPDTWGVPTFPSVGVPSSTDMRVHVRVCSYVHACVHACGCIFVCVPVCVYEHMCVYKCTLMHALCGCVFRHVCARTCVRACTHKCLCMCTNVCVCAVHLCMFLCRRVQVCLSVFMRAHTHEHTHTCFVCGCLNRCACMCVCLDGFMCACAQACCAHNFTRAHINSFACTCVRTHTCACLHVCTCMCMGVCAYMNCSRG